MVGMVLGMGLTRLTASHHAAAWAAFLVLTWLHVYANMRALRCLHMTSLNRPRLDLLLACCWGPGAQVGGAERGGRRWAGWGREDAGGLAACAGAARRLPRPLWKAGDWAQRVGMHAAGSLA